ncbi:hypothetical protein SDC9_63106 [bioreactor metagenome]|uniref:Uncharacterized protein n=1 Tax=bioreactor metagenome TaxID=1076179 RepID=A0A644XKM3_9ZZZZ
MEINVHDLCRIQRISDVDRWIFVPLNDIHVLSAQFVYDRLDTLASWSYAGADRVDVFIAGAHGYF